MSPRRPLVATGQPLLLVCRRPLVAQRLLHLAQLPKANLPPGSLHHHLSMRGTPSGSSLRQSRHQPRHRSTCSHQCLSDQCRCGQPLHLHRACLHQVCLHASCLLGTHSPLRSLSRRRQWQSGCKWVWSRRHLRISLAGCCQRPCPQSCLLWCSFRERPRPRLQRRLRPCRRSRLLWCSFRERPRPRLQRRLPPCRRSCRL